MPDHHLIDPTVDHVWAVDVVDSYTVYVVAETAEEAERIAEETEPAYRARELTEPLDPTHGDGTFISWRSREATVVDIGDDCRAERDQVVRDHACGLPDPVGVQDVRPG